MFRKNLLKISLVLPLVAMSAAAYAGSTITDKNYWPSEARQSPQGRAVVVPQNNVRSAYASDRAVQSATDLNDAEPAWRYQGGPKSR